MRPVIAVAALLVAACSDQVVRFEPRWPDDHFAVVIAADEVGNALAPTPLLLRPGDPPSFEIESTGLVRLFVRAYPPSAAGVVQASPSCGVVIGGSGPELPPAASSWATGPIDLRDVGAAALDMEVEPRPFDLRSSCAEPCPEIRPSAIPLPDGDRANLVAFISERTAYVVWGPGGLIAQVESSSVAELFHPFPGLGGQPIADLLSTPPALHGLTAGKYFRTSSHRDLDLMLPTPNARKLTVGEGGRLAIAWDEDGFSVLTGTVASTDGARAPDRPPEGFGPQLRAMLAVRRDRIVLHDFGRLWSWNGFRWSEEHVRPPGESVVAFAGDQDALYAIGDGELVRQRDERSATWRLLPKPFDRAIDLRGGLVLGPRRLLVYGTEGRIALWTGRAWCPVVSPVTGTIDSVSASPTGSRIFLVGQSLSEIVRLIL